MQQSAFESMIILTAECPDDGSVVTSAVRVAGVRRRGGWDVVQLQQTPLLWGFLYTSPSRVCICRRHGDLKRLMHPCASCCFTGVCCLSGGIRRPSCCLS